MSKAKKMIPNKREKKQELLIFMGKGAQRELNKAMEAWITKHGYKKP